MRGVLAIARKELRTSLRNRWVLAATLLLMGLALALAWLGSAPVGEVKADRLTVTVVSLTSLSVFLIPLIALLISHDAVVGEVARGTMLLMLAYPVERRQVIAGKFLGHLAVIAIAAIVGYGVAGGAVYLAGAGGTAGVPAFAWLIASTVLLGGCFIALGYLASTLVRERATAAGVALGIWLVVVVVYDLALLGVLVGAAGVISQQAFSLLLMLNPADAFRMFNLAGSESASMIAGMAGAAAEAAPTRGVLAAVLLAWAIVPLGLAMAAFRRRDV